MAELPSHPESDYSTGGRNPSTPERDWVGIIVIGAVGALVLLIILLHLTGVVGPAAH